MRPGTGPSSTVILFLLCLHVCFLLNYTSHFTSVKSVNLIKDFARQVQDCIMSFWRSLQPERIALMSLPDVCQLFKSYDRQLFKVL